MRSPVPTLKHAYHLILDLGVYDGLKTCLEYEFQPRTTSFHFPNSLRSYAVPWNYNWKYIEHRKDSESRVIEYVQKNVSEGDIAIDIGAFLGEYSLLFSGLVGSSGQVISFEPEGRNFERLKETLKTNGLTNIALEPYCVAERAREAELANYAGPGSNTASIVRCEGVEAIRQRTKVQCISLDEYCADKRICPRWIKIDVEGAEKLVALGMKNTSRSCRPKVLLEFHRKFMSENDARSTWLEFTEEAKKALYLDGLGETYDYLEELDLAELPNSDLFNSVIEY